MGYFTDMTFREMTMADAKMYRMEVKRDTQRACDDADRMIDPEAYARKQEEMQKLHRSMGAYFQNSNNNLLYFGGHFCGPYPYGSAVVAGAVAGWF